MKPRYHYPSGQPSAYQTDTYQITVTAEEIGHISSALNALARTRADDSLTFQDALLAYESIGLRALASRIVRVRGAL